MLSSACLIEDVALVSSSDERSYHLVLPDNPAEWAGAPIVLLFHGHSSDNDGLLGLSGVPAPFAVWLDIAAEEGLILAVPNGLYSSESEKGWNDCRADAATNSNADDVQFVSDLIDVLVTAYGADPDRVYAAGTSNGGHFAVRLALELPEKITAFAAISASMAENSECIDSTTPPVAALFMNGTDDPLLPYDGGDMAGQRGAVVPVDEAVSAWVERNGASSVPMITQLPDLDQTDGSTVERITYPGGSSSEVVQYRIDGGGHTIPSIDQRYPGFLTQILGNQNGDIESARELWGFFEDKTAESGWSVSDPGGPGVFGVGSWESVVEEHRSLDGTLQPLPMQVWFPADASMSVPSTSGPFPLIVYSHGASGAPGSSTFLTEYLTTHGFVVAAVQHPNRSLAERGEAFAERPGEVRSAVEFLLDESASSGALLEGVIDPDRLGITGHSFGGLTTIALLGEEETLFDAGLAMAPGIRPNDPADVTDDLTSIAVPVMFMMGQADTLALYENLSAGYETIPDSTQRYALVLPNATHGSYTDDCSRFGICPPGTLDRELGHELIDTYATAFFQVHLAGQTQFADYLEARNDIAAGEALLFDGDIQP